MKDPEFKPGATHNSHRSTYSKESQSTKAQLRGEQSLISTFKTATCHSIIIVKYLVLICSFSITPILFNPPPEILLAEAGDPSSSQGSLEIVEFEAEVPTPGGDGGGREDTNNCELIGEPEQQGKQGRGKRTAKGWRQHKKGAKSRGQEDTQRKAKVNDKIEKIKRAREDLKNPYDEMDIDTKKEHAVFFYCDKMAEILSDNEVAFSSKSVAVKKKVAKKVGVSVATMKRWVLDYMCEEELKKSKRGKHSKVASPIDDPKFKAAFSQYVRAHAKPKGMYCAQATI